MNSSNTRPKRAFTYRIPAPIFKRLKSRQARLEREAGGQEVSLQYVISEALTVGLDNLEEAVEQ